jgi:DNA-binding protein H-NS
MKMAKKIDLDAMPTDEMWQLHVEIGRLLSIRLNSEKRELERRLVRLHRESDVKQEDASVAERQLQERRRYPRVLPKYQNPNEPSETWSGRGKQPRWLIAALKAGHVIEDFIISNIEPNENNSPRRLAKGS